MDDSQVLERLTEVEGAVRRAGETLTVHSVEPPGVRAGSCGAYWTSRGKVSACAPSAI